MRSWSPWLRPSKQCPNQHCPNQYCLEPPPHARPPCPQTRPLAPRSGLRKAEALMPKLVVATRRSELALAQCRMFVRKLVLKYPDLEVEELHVTTTGDRIVDRPLTELGGKGLFLKEIEEALLDGRADFAVHSMKDVPPDIHPALTIGCVPEREDPRDVLISTNGE